MVILFFSSYCPLQIRALKHTCDNLMMAMREICCTDEGDQGLKKACNQEIFKAIKLEASNWCQLVEDNE